MDEFRKQLDELMGADRNGDRAPVKKQHWSDRNVCHLYLAGCCPGKLFTNTKMNLAECNKIHSDEIKAEYEKEMKERPHSDPGYDIALIRELERFVNDCDRRVDKARRRLQAEQPTDDVSAERAEKINSMTVEIAELTKKAEEKGEEGDVDESLEIMNKVEDLKRSKMELESLTAPVDEKLAQGVVTNQKLRCCDVCAALLSIQDSDRRLADHFGGKTHVGFLTMRETLTKLREEQRAKRDRDMGAERDRRSSRRDGERRYREDHDNRDRHRERNRRNDGDSYRERERDRYSSSRDRDRGGRDRDGGRRRDRDRDSGRSGRDYDRDRRDRRR